MKILIIAEKPKVGQKIAFALSKDYKKKRHGRANYYELSINDKDIVIASAAGHLYSLKEKKSSRDYPTFNIEWAPLYEIGKGKSYIKQYVNLLKKLGKETDVFIIATDYDIEGELLGYNALKYAVLGDKTINKDKIKRMRFSTLTTLDLRKAYSELSEVDYNLVEAGETRHILDWYWGINISRALTEAAKKGLKRYAVFSAGRVQTPALAILVRREREISSFKPEPYIKVYADLKVSRKKIRAEHVLGRIFDIQKAKEILNKIKDEKEGIIRNVTRKESIIPPPVPFDLGTLQSEAYKAFRLTPKQVQDIAQSLYEEGCISYPRTSSQKLPPAIGYRRIIEALGKNAKFVEASKKLLKKERLYPRQGKKDDPAHPAIFPTGQTPKKLESRAEKIYELITYRYLATFGDSMQRENINVKVEIKDEDFRFSASRTLERGWSEFYPYLKLEEIQLPEINEEDIFKILKIAGDEKDTSPPRRYNPASLVRELEALRLGTKATRAEIVDTLYRREYIKGVSIKVTPLGMRVIEALEKNIPKIIDENLTKYFEEKLEKIQRGEAKKEETIEEAKEELIKTLKIFREKEESIGKSIAAGFIEKDREMKIIGKCPNCGSNLRIIRSKASGKQFIGCSNYPKCKTSFPLPQKKNVYPTDKLCSTCGLPMVSISFGNRKILSCIDMNCKSKGKYNQARQKEK